MPKIKLSQNTYTIEIEIEKLKCSVTTADSSDETEMQIREFAS
jgi:hypothetical protein